MKVLYLACVVIERSQHHSRLLSYPELWSDPLAEMVLLKGWCWEPNLQITSQLLLWQKHGLDVIKQKVTSLSKWGLEINTLYLPRNSNLLQMTVGNMSIFLVFLTCFLFFRHINEDKRKTEGQRQIFDVVYEVDGCPVSKSIAWNKFYRME